MSGTSEIGLTDDDRERLWTQYRTVNCLNFDYRGDSGGGD